MENFEKYLDGKVEFYKMLLQIMAGSPNTDQIHDIEVSLETLNDIIHHFNLFVKGVTNGKTE